MCWREDSRSDPQTKPLRVGAVAVLDKVRHLLCTTGRFPAVDFFNDRHLISNCFSPVARQHPGFLNTQETNQDPSRVQRTTSLERALKLPVLLELRLDHLLDLVAAWAEGQARLSSETLLDEGVERVLGALDTRLDDDEIGAGDAVLELESLSHGVGVALQTLDGLVVEAGDGLGEDVAGTGDAAGVAGDEGGEEAGVSARASETARIGEETAIAAPDSGDTYDSEKPGRTWNWPVAVTFLSCECLATYSSDWV